MQHKQNTASLSPISMSLHCPSCDLIKVNKFFVSKQLLPHLKHFQDSVRKLAKDISLQIKFMYLCVCVCRVAFFPLRSKETDYYQQKNNRFTMVQGLLWTIKMSNVNFLEKFLYLLLIHLVNMYVLSIYFPWHLYLSLTDSYVSHSGFSFQLRYGSGIWVS